jgi:hypothetical protein
MADEDILQTIRTLVDEEHELRRAAPDDADRLATIEATLDQCWDLLRQRRSRREFGEDASQARPRDINTVERYQQ